MGVWPRLWGHGRGLGQSRGDVVKAEGGLEGRGGGAKAVGSGQGCGGVAKAVGAWPTSLAKDVGSWSRPKEG